MDLNTIFDGWGTELVSLLVGLLATGIGYRFYKNGKIYQKQKAGNNAKQKQEIKNSHEKIHPKNKRLVITQNRFKSVNYGYF